MCETCKQLKKIFYDATEEYQKIYPSLSHIDKAGSEYKLPRSWTPNQHDILTMQLWKRMYEAIRELA